VLFALIATSSFPVIREVILFVFNRDIYDDPSIYIRSTDFWLPYVAALDSPFFGFSSIETYQDKMLIAIDRQMTGITNSFGAYFYYYGYIWSGFFVIWVFNAFSRAGLAFGSIPYVLFFGSMYEPIGYTCFFFFLVFLASMAPRNTAVVDVRKKTISHAIRARAF
jgi:hypothetical protein